MKTQSQLKRFLERHYFASIVVAFIGGLLASSSSHLLNRMIDRAAFDTPTRVYSVSESTNYFPIEEGNTWVYKGQHEFTLPSTNIVVNTDETPIVVNNNITLKMEILKVYRFPHLVLAVLNDWPFDRVWDEGIEKKCALVVVGGKVFKIDDPVAIEGIANSGDALGILTEEDLVLEFPLSKGQRFGDSKSIGRRDASYLWHVDQEYDIASSFSKESKLAYRIVMKTGPDHCIMMFQPNVGIIEYEYNHHGTVEKLGLKLSEFIAKRKAQ